MTTGRGGATRRGSSFWSVSLPDRLDPFAPSLADAAADGCWTARWPAIEQHAPAAALVAGVIAALLWPGVEVLYSESLILLMCVIVASVLSGSVALAFVAGYVPAHLLGVPDPAAATLATDTNLEWFVLRTGSRLIAYLLLAMLVLRLPAVARRWADDAVAHLPRSSLPVPHEAVRASAYAALLGLLVYMWSQAAVVLLRPVFTWLGSEPSVDAITHVQLEYEWLVLTAAVAAVVRISLESHATAERHRPQMQQRPRPVLAGKRGSQWRRVGTRARTLLSAALITLVLAGAYEGWIDAVVTFGAAVVIGLIRTGQIRVVPQRWTEPLRRVPALVRVVAGVVLGLVVARIVVGSTTESFRPVLFAALTTVLMLAVLLPAERTAPVDGHVSAPGRGRFVLLGVGMIGAFAGASLLGDNLVPAAYADNCGIPEDCWDVIGGAFAAAAGAGVVAAAWAWGPEGDAADDPLPPPQTDDDAVDDPCVDL